VGIIGHNSTDTLFPKIPPRGWLWLGFFKGDDSEDLLTEFCRQQCEIRGIHEINLSWLSNVISIRVLVKQGSRIIFHENPRDIYENDRRESEPRTDFHGGDNGNRRHSSHKLLIGDNVFVRNSKEQPGSYSFN